MTPDGLPATLSRAAIAVKNHHTAAAADLLRGRLDPAGYVVSFQNGLTAAAIEAVTGPGRLVTSFVNFGADVLAPGRILQGNIGTFRIGEPGGGPVTPRVAELAAALPYAVATDNILGFLWAKEAYGAMLFAGAVSDLSIAATLEDPRWRPLMLAIAREVLAQSPVTPEGFDGFDPADLEGSLARLATFNRGSAKSHSGVYRDLAVRHRPTEVGDLAGLPARSPGTSPRSSGPSSAASAPARWPTWSCWPRARPPSGSAARCTPWSPSTRPPAGRRKARCTGWPWRSRT